MNPEFQKIIEQMVESTLDSPPFATLTRPQYEQKKLELNQFFQELIIFTLFNNLNEAQMLEVEKLDFSSPEAGQKFAQWAAGIPNFLSLYQMDLNKYSSQIKQTGQLPVLE